MECYKMTRRITQLFLNLLFLSLLNTHLSATDILLTDDSMAEAFALPLGKFFCHIYSIPLYV